MTSSRSDIKTRIRLLAKKRDSLEALPNRDTFVGEITALDEKIHQLLIKHHLTETDIVEAKKDSRITYLDFPLASGETQAASTEWLYQLLSTVAWFYRCTSLVIPSRTRPMGTLIGTALDIELAHQSYCSLRNRLEEACEKQSAFARKIGVIGKYGVHIRTWKKSFYLGAVQSIANRFRDLEKSTYAHLELPEGVNTSTALARIDNSTERQEFIKATWQTLRSRASDLSGLDRSSYQAGSVIGRDLPLQEGLQG